MKYKLIRCKKYSCDGCVFRKLSETQHNFICIKPVTIDTCTPKKDTYSNEYSIYVEDEEDVE